MKPIYTEKTVSQFVTHVSDQLHAFSGATIAASAAQAAALGEACMQISLDNQVDKLNWDDASARIAAMLDIKTRLLGWCDTDATALIEYTTLGAVSQEVGGDAVLYDSPTEIARLSLEAAHSLQNFRPLAYQNISDDLEMALHLLVGAARAAMLLLDSNLRHWSPADIAARDAALRDLRARLDQLTLVDNLQENPA